MPMDEIVEREFTALRDTIAQIERNRAAAQEIEREALRSWKVDLDSRLARMNEFRQAMLDQQAHFVTREQFEAAVSSGVDRYEASRDYVDSELRPLRADVERATKTDWGLLASVASVAIAMVAGCWLVIGLQIDARVGPIRVDLEQARTATAQNTERLRFVESSSNSSAQADVASRADRSQLNERIRQLEASAPNGTQAAADVVNLKFNYATILDRIQQIRSQLAQQTAALIEVETQFCGSDNLRNQIHATDLRLQAMLWKKVFGDDMPVANAFYARVGRCSPGVDRSTPG
jgi:uncharacterized protein YdcH (DUF465 family)